MSATITVIATPIESPEQFLAMGLEERRRSSIGWRTQPSRTGNHPCTVLMMATGIDLACLGLPPERDAATGERVETLMIDRRTLDEVVPRLRALVDTDRDATARALVAYAAGRGDIARVTTTLAEGDWPETDDVADEAAAFAKHIFGYGRFAAAMKLGLCWEYRGEFPLAHAHR